MAADDAAHTPGPVEVSSAPLTRAACVQCGSHDVCRDANARWDEQAGAWVLAGLYYECTCQECGADGATIIAFVPTAADCSRREP